MIAQFLNHRSSYTNLHTYLDFKAEQKKLNFYIREEKILIFIHI